MGLSGFKKGEFSREYQALITKNGFAFQFNLFCILQVSDTFSVFYECLKTHGHDDDVSPGVWISRDTYLHLGLEGHDSDGNENEGQNDDGVRGVSGGKLRDRGSRRWRGGPLRRRRDRRGS